jgi:polyphosphate kinase 2 (PPK2 family)
MANIARGVHNGAACPRPENIMQLLPATRLADVDLRAALARPAYRKRHKVAQTQLRELQLAYKFAGRRAVIVIEGWDAVGKGGLIQRLTAPLDPRGYQVWPIGAPTETERGEHYLQRFWRRLPRLGVLAIFDRSWYGRVLVERAESLSKPAVWRRAYDEINAFEKMLTDDGVRIVKLFLHVSVETQRERLAGRMADPLESWKLGASDLRNIVLRPDYEAAINEMFERCSPPAAPWFAVPFADKSFGRIAALETIIGRLGEGMDLTPPPLAKDLVAAARRMGLAPPTKPSRRAKKK